MPGPFELKVEDVFHISGRGYICSGKISLGTIRVGDEVLAKTSGGEQRCTVTGVNLGKELVDEAATGMDVALLLRGFDPKKLKDATGVPVWDGERPVEVVLREGSVASAVSAGSSSMEASIAKMRGGDEKPWWKFW